jgi:hypothetical protein
MKNKIIVFLIVSFAALVIAARLGWEGYRNYLVFKGNWNIHSGFLREEAIWLFVYLLAGFSFFMALFKGAGE